MNRSHSYEATAHLTGDWTMAGVVKQVSRLTELDIRGIRPGIPAVIDCSGIDRIDLSGFQLLYVWLHCLELNGLRPELVNVPPWMREAQLRQGLAQAFEGEPSEREAAERPPRAATRCAGIHQ